MTGKVEDVNESDLNSPRAEIFRSKLIADFHLLDSVNEQGSQTEPPKYYTHDILDQEKMMKLMKNKPSGLVRFQVYHDKEQRQITIVDRRGNRVKARNSTWPPLDLWAHWIVQSAIFQNCILALILVNSIVLGIQVEIKDSLHPVAQKIHLALEIFDYCTLIVFVLEISLKLLDDFWAFWKNRWNIFDFGVTFFSVVPEIVEVLAKDSTSVGGNATSQLSSVANNMRTFRVLRSLKMVSRFQKVRLIVLAVTKAFQAMVFITVLLFIFAYIFAIIGVIFFDQYGSETLDLYYKDSFSTIITSLITLFQLFTLDHWREIFDDVNKMANSYFCFVYIFLWIIIGSFIFRNIFVGIMVNNFQGIRNELFVEVKQLRDREQRDLEMAEFARELERQTDMKQASGHSVRVASPSMESSVSDVPVAGFGSLKELRAALSEHMVQTEQSSGEWHDIVERNLENLTKEELCFCWPRDSLFTYFLMMEALQENLYEREQLQNLAAEALSQIHDT